MGNVGGKVSLEPIELRKFFGHPLESLYQLIDLS